MAELVDAPDSKSSGSNTVRVRFPLRPPRIFKKMLDLFFEIGYTEIVELSFAPVMFGGFMMGTKFSCGII